MEIGPLNIGPIEIGFPAVQAALSGYSDWPMRVIARRLGAPYTLCEVLLDRFVLDQKLHRANRRHLKVTEEEHPVGGQLMGADPAQFAPQRSSSRRPASTSWTSTSAAR